MPIPEITRPPEKLPNPGKPPNPQNPPKLSAGDILMNGHTHIPADEMFGEFRYLNPGSVSIPKNGSGHSYMIYENGEFILKELD